LTAAEVFVDQVLEATVVGSFSRIGYDVRSRLGRWDEPPSMAGRSVVVTGATSGLGHVAATRLASLGASVRFVARDDARARVARNSIIEASGNGDVGYVIADMADFAAVHGVADRLVDEFDVLDVLVHNAGAISPRPAWAPDGTEITVAAQLVGPFVLTGLLLPWLRQARPGRVVTVSSGGMYAQRFDLDQLEMVTEHYDGVTAYARVKRAQLVLNHEWARRVDPRAVVFHAMHPGWADTPGVRSSLPGFHAVMRPLLRTPEQGADTIVWLAAGPGAPDVTGAFWLDRRQRWEHKLPWTRPNDPLADQARLWDWCVARAGQWAAPAVDPA
jgi:NAD(P)-dependent dehydrogenase (short-subunit alcohol dehydrogenase family)